MYKYLAYETTSKPILNDTFMKLIPKMLTAWNPLIMLSDNTSVAKSAVDYRVKYKLRPGEFFYTDKSSKKHVGKSKEATVSLDNMTKLLKKEADVKKKIAELQEKELKLNEGAELLLETTKLMFPSTYVGPLFRDNGKSYTENLLSGEGTGNIAGNLAIDALLPYGVARSFSTGSRYAGLVANRYRFANLSLANPQSIKHIAQALGYTPHKEFLVSRPITLTKTSQFIEQSGAVAIKPGTNPRETTELHLLPILKHDRLLGITRAIENPELSEDVSTLFKFLPSHTVITSSKNALSIPQIIPARSWSERMKYYLTGKTPKLDLSNIKGYSTDVMLLFKMKGIGTTTPSLTTRLTGLNAHGKHWNRFEKYFGPIDKNNFVYFEDMTPLLVELWNREVSPKWGHYIDPETRTSEQMILITK